MQGKLVLKEEINVRYTEILFRSALFCLKHRTVRIEDIGIDHSHQRIRILFGTHMFERRGIENIVIAADPAFLLFHIRFSVPAYPAGLQGGT